MEKLPILNPDAAFIESLPDEIYHLSEVISLLSDRKQLSLTTIALNELIKNYLEQPNADDQLIKDALLLHFTLSTASITETLTINHDKIEISM